MKNVLIFLLAIVLDVVIFVCRPAVGAFAGWLFALIFGDITADYCTAAGWPVICMWQIGALLGFLSVFFSDKIAKGDKIAKKVKKHF